jgi:hypothetical protein
VVCACSTGTRTKTLTAIGSPGGGSFAWSSGNAGVATVSGTGQTATVEGVAPGTATITVTYTTATGTATATANVIVVLVELELKNSGTIVAASENEDYAAEKASAGGTDVLGPLPMGQGRGDFPGRTYTAPNMVIGTVSPAEATALTFRWKRLITRRSWHIRLNAAGDKWIVTQRSKRGPLDDDTGADDFNDPTPSSNNKIYIYDCSGLLPGNSASDKVGDFIREEKFFLYRVERDDNGSWVTCAELNTGQVIIVKRKATTGTTATDWEGVENSFEVRTLDALITEAEVRAMVGGSIAIEIDAGANS